VARTSAIRIAVIVVCALGVAGMVVGSATKHNGAAITFGLITAVAILCQMVATTVLNELRGAKGAPVPGFVDRVEQEGAAVEAAISDLVDAGAEEDAVRDLVRRAVRLGRESNQQVS
jgi:hypothetical protein